MSTPDDRTRDAREVAAFISKGLTPKDTAEKVDFPLAYVNELTEMLEFEDALKHIGGEPALERWEEYKLDKSASVNLRTRVREKLGDYFDILDAIAMDPRAKPETRFAVIKELLVQAKISEDEQAPTVADFPQSFFTAIVQAAKEEDHWMAKRV